MAEDAKNKITETISQDNVSRPSLKLKFFITIDQFSFALDSALFGRNYESGS